MQMGAAAWNQGWAKQTFVPDLSGADLRAAELANVSFYQPDLDNQGSNLVFAERLYADYKLKVFDAGSHRITCKLAKRFISRLMRPFESTTAFC